MSFRNRIVVLSTVLVILVVLYVVGITQLGGREAPPEPLVAEGALSGVVGVEIADASGVTLALEQAGGIWQVRLGGELFPARPERVESMLSALGDLTLNRTVATSPERHEQLGLTESAGTLLTLRRPQGASIELLFGDLAPQGGEGFVRFAGEETSYAVDSALNFYFTQETSYWAELRLVRNITPEDIVEITVEADSLPLLNPDQPVVADYTVARGSGPEWNLIPGPAMELANQEVERIAAALANLQASDYVVSPDEGLFAEEQGSVSFSTEDGERYRFTVGVSLPENQFALRAEGPGVPQSESGDPLVFQIGAWSLERVFKNLDALVPSEDSEAP